MASKQVGKAGNRLVRYMYVKNDGKRHTPEHPPISIGTIVFHRDETEGPSIEKSQLRVQIVIFDKEEDQSNVFLCPKSCLEEVEEDKLTFLSAIKDKEERFKLFKDDRFDLPLNTRESVTVLHPFNKNRVKGNVRGEATRRPDRMGTWWKIALDEVTHSQFKLCNGKV